MKRITTTGITVLALLIGGPALAEATGDGWMGPTVVDGSAIDHTLIALNVHIQDKYRQDDMLAALTEPLHSDFANTAVATAHGPRVDYLPSRPPFGYEVSDGRSLDDGLQLFHREIALRGNDLFIQVAQDVQVRGDAFALAARGAGLDEQMARYQMEMIEIDNGFGNAIFDGLSLQASVAAINQRIKDQVVRETQIAAAVPPVDDSTFLRVMVALAYSY